LFGTRTLRQKPEIKEVLSVLRDSGGPKIVDETAFAFKRRLQNNSSFQEVQSVGPQFKKSRATRAHLSSWKRESPASGPCPLPSLLSLCILRGHKAITSSFRGQHWGCSDKVVTLGEEYIFLKSFLVVFKMKPFPFFHLKDLLTCNYLISHDVLQCVYTQS